MRYGNGGGGIRKDVATFKGGARRLPGCINLLERRGEEWREYCPTKESGVGKVK